MNVLIIRTDDTSEVDDVDVNLELLQRVVGGYIEVFSGNGSWHAYCNEQGKLQGLPINRVATALAARLGWSHDGDVIVGDAIFLGDGPDGDEASVPDYVIDELTHFLAS